MKRHPRGRSIREFRIRGGGRRAFAKTFPEPLFTDHVIGLAHVVCLSILIQTPLPRTCLPP